MYHGDSKKLSNPGYIQLVRPCNSSERVLDGKDRINYPLLLELPYLRIKPKTQSQQRKK